MFAQGELPILAILRGIEQKDVSPLTDIFIKAGIKYIEVTMNTINAGLIIKNFNKVSENKFYTGAGTVLKLPDLNIALDAEAAFIVTPCVNNDVISACVSQKIPVIPGALTPTEIFKAWDLGAEMVKLFPASLHGPSYIHTLRGPLEKVKLMAVGGVDENNIAEYFRQGADAVAFGAGILKDSWLKNNKYDLIAENLNRLILAFKGTHSA